MKIQFSRASEKIWSHFFSRFFEIETLVNDWLGGAKHIRLIWFHSEFLVHVAQTPSKTLSGHKRFWIMIRRQFFSSTSFTCFKVAGFHRGFKPLSLSIRLHRIPSLKSGAARHLENIHKCFFRSQLIFLVKAYKLGCLTSVASSAPPRGFPPVWAVSYQASPSGGGRWAPRRWARSPSSLPGCPWQTLRATARSLTSGCSLREEYELKHWRTEAHKPKANKNMRTEN